MLDKEKGLKKPADSQASALESAGFLLIICVKEKLFHLHITGNALSAFGEITVFKITIFFAGSNKNCGCFVLAGEVPNHIADLMLVQ